MTYEEKLLNPKCTHKINDKRIRDAVRDKYGGKCAYCGDVLKSMSIDHIEPKRRHLTYTNRNNLIVPDRLKKGADHINNYNPCCKSCNSSKGSMDIEQFRKQISDRHDYMMKYFSEYRSMIKFKRVAVNPDPVIFYFETL